MAQDTTMNFQFTQLGVDLATKALAGTTKITFTKAVASSENHFSDTEATALALTTLGEVQQTIEIKTVMAVTDNKAQVKVPVVIDRGAITTDYSLLSIGLYAKDDDGTEVLYAVNGLQDAVEMRANAFNSTYSIDLYVAVGTSDNVTLTVDPVGMVTHADFDAMMKRVAFIDKPNVFSERQTLAGGATDGEGNAYATTKDVAIDLNNGLNTKVTDNKNGTEQLNGVQVQPFNKLSDTIGGRNLLPGTSGTLQTVTNATDWNANLPIITPVVTTVGSDTTYTSRTWIAPASYDTSVQILWKDPSGAQHYNNGNTIYAGNSGYSTLTATFLAGSSIQYVRIAFTAKQSTPSSVSYKEMKFEQGSVATDWTPAPEDKVNVADMRKPANDVAGIEEVNAKQDKIGYTPANDSKVLHSTVTELYSTNMNTVLTAGFYQLKSGTNGMPNADAWTIYQVVPLDSSLNGVQIAYETNNTILGIRSWDTWGGGNHFSSWVQFADDSKVAHLSGANNFDTVPTVNNNPLLLASSLPSDLARTSQQTNFTDGLQKGGKDVATVDEVADAKAAAITQALNDAKAEIAKLPKHVTLTQAQFDALATKDANTYYYITAG